MSSYLSLLAGGGATFYTNQYTALHGMPSGSCWTPAEVPYPQAPCPINNLRAGELAVGGRRKAEVSLDSELVVPATTAPQPQCEVCQLSGVCF